MSPVVHLVMFGWLPVVVGLFAVLPPRRAVIAAFLFAWLFLPVAEYKISGLPDYTKMSATCWGVFIAAALFDSKSLTGFKPHPLDLVMVLWCLCPIPSSITNGCGMYDGLAISLRQIVKWGFPYLIGRMYFSSAEALKELAVGVFAGGMIYVPLCLYEMRFSPQLHYDVYGFHQHSFAQTRRWGGWRPMVFLDHGLMLGVWMSSASLVGLWLWKTRVIEEWQGIPMKWMVWLLIATTVLCRSTGALAQLVMGSSLLLATERIGRPLLLALLVAVPLAYIPARVSGAWSGDGLVSFISGTISAERADSLHCRLLNEKILAERAMERPLFGWATWGGSRVYDDQGKDISVTDGLWIITLGCHGLFGLALMTLSVLLPVIVFLRRMPVPLWSGPEAGPAAALAVLLALYMVDCLLNAMVNPIFMVVAGGIAGLAATAAVAEGEGEALEDAADDGEPAMAYAPRFL